MWINLPITSSSPLIFSPGLVWFCISHVAGSNRVPKDTILNCLLTFLWKWSGTTTGLKISEKIANVQSKLWKTSKGIWNSIAQDHFKKRHSTVQFQLKIMLCITWNSGAVVSSHLTGSGFLLPVLLVPALVVSGCSSFLTQFKSCTLG